MKKRPKNKVLYITGAMIPLSWIVLIILSQMDVFTVSQSVWSLDHTIVSMIAYLPIFAFVGCGIIDASKTNKKRV